MAERPLTTVTLRALEGEPLRHDVICQMVEAAARAIAERQGIALLGLSTDARSITMTLEAERIAAVGFAAELRRLTTAWYAQKFGRATLWGDPPTRGDVDGATERGGPDASDDDEHWLGDPEAWKSNR
jgi:hypothetical protein